MGDPTTKELATKLDELSAKLAGFEDIKLPSDAELQGPLDEIIRALVRLSKDSLASAPLSPQSSGWRALHDACAAFLGGEQLAEAVPAPRGPLTMPPRGEPRGEVVPPLAKRGAVPAPRTRPDLGGTGGASLAPPTVQTGAQRQPQTGTAGAGDIRNRPDVAAELDRLKAPRK